MGQALSRLVFLILTALLLTACGSGNDSNGSSGSGGSSGGGSGGDTSTGEPSVTLALVDNSTNIATTQVSDASPGRLVATLLGADDLPVVGEVVTFSTTLGALSPSLGTALTDANGVASIILRAGTVAGAGSASVSATVDSQTATAQLNFSSAGDAATGNVGTDGSISLQITDGTDPITQISAATPGTLNATLLDANNLPMVGEVVSFSTTIGVISPASGTALTNAQGVATVVLGAGSIRGAGTATAISGSLSGSINFSTLGDVTGGPITDEVSRIGLTADTNTISSNGLDKATVTLTALDADNVRVVGAEFALTVTGGALSTKSVTTGDDGSAAFTVDSGIDKGNQVLTVTASNGITVGTINISVLGTTLTLESDRTSVGLSTAADPAIAALTLSAKDGGDSPLANASLTLTATGGVLTDSSDNTNTGASITIETNALGLASATYAGGATGGNETITLSGFGESVSVPVLVSGSAFTLVDSRLGELDITLTDTITLTKLDENGAAVAGSQILFTTTNGTLDGTGKSFVTKTTNVSGQASVTLAGNNTGPSVVRATDALDDLSDSLTINVVSKTPTSVSLSVTPATVATALDDSVPTTTVSAVVRDASNRVVENVAVAFTVIDGPGAGEAISPGVATTNSAGIATATFSSGTLPSALDGVTVQAELVDFADVKDTTTITIAGVPARVVIGTTNEIETVKIGTLEDAYAMPFTVLVTDVAGNPVANQSVNLTLHPLQYRTGGFTDSLDIKTMVILGTFANEDSDRNGILLPSEDLDCDGVLDAGEDTNSNGLMDTNEDPNCNGQLDPGNVATIPATVTTDTNGFAGFSVTYAKSFGLWVDVEITASTNVSGTESSSTLIRTLHIEVNDTPYINSPFGAGSIGEVLETAVGTCSDSDADGIGDAGGVFTKGVLELDSATIASRGSAAVNAYLVTNGVDGELCTDLITAPETVAFSSNCAAEATPKATLDSNVTSTSGIATSVYRGAGCEGVDIITATLANGEEASVNITVAAADIGSIQFVSVSESDLAISGTGGAERPESSSITFRVLDEFSTPVANKKVAFELLQDVGDIGLDNALADGDFAVSDGNGDVVVTLISGNVPATVRVRAWLLNDDAILGAATAGDIFEDATSGLRISNISDLITVSSGMPVQGKLVLSMSNHKPEADNVNGRTVTVTAHATDRFNHKVPDGSTVFFYTEYGLIESSCETTDGTCSVKWTSVNQSGKPADRKVTIMATMVGEENFSDLNANGLFDLGDVATFQASTNELGEAFVDDDESGTHDSPDEFFLDRDSSGTYTAAVVGAPLFSGVMCDQAAITAGHCADTVDVRDSGVLMMINTTTELTITGLPGAIVTPQTITFGVEDANGNPPPTGATVTVSTTNGELSRTTFVVGDGFNAFFGSVTVSTDGTSDTGSLTVSVDVPFGSDTTSVGVPVAD